MTPHSRSPAFARRRSAANKCARASPSRGDGVPFNTQGIDAFPTSGGCVFSGIPFGATDIDTVTIG